MSQITLITFAGTIVLFSICIIGMKMLLGKERKEKNALENRVSQFDEEKKLLLYQTTVLKNIEESSSSRLNVEKVISVITQNIDTIIPYSVVSFLIVKRDRLTRKIIMKEPVSQDFLDKLNDSMMRSLSELTDSPLPFTIEEEVKGILAGDLYKYPFTSYFHIPILVNGKAIGLLTISSTKANCFTLAQMTILHHIVNLASRSLSSLEMVMTIEKGKLTAMIGSMADGLFMIDKNRQITVMNTAAQDCLHMLNDSPPIGEVLAALPGEYNFDQKLDRALMHNESFKEKEMTLGDKIFEVIITPIMDVNPEDSEGVIGVSVLLHDITLERSIAKMKEDFTHVMVHELRSPLTSIRASSKLLISTPSLVDEDKKKFLNMIYEVSTKLLDNVSLILDTAKLDSGVFTVLKTPGDLKAVIQDKITIFIPQAVEKSIQLVSNIDPTLPNFLFDQPRIGQVITNLVSNSLKFTPVGGMITVTARQEPGKVIVSCADNGDGIPKDKQHLLFSKFGQVQSAQSAKGTGIGLYFVKGVVESHGGTVTLESEEKKGTTISFTLPLDLTKQQPTNILHTGTQQPAPAPALHTVPPSAEAKQVTSQNPATPANN